MLHAPRPEHATPEHAIPEPAIGGRPRPQASRHPSAVDAHVAAAIRVHRKAANMSQTALAQALGLTFQQIQKYESARNRVSAGRLADIAQVFATTPGAFFPAPEHANGPAGLAADRLADLNRALAIVSRLMATRRDELADLRRVHTTLAMAALGQGTGARSQASGEPAIDSHT